LTVLLLISHYLLINELFLNSFQAYVFERVVEFQLLFHVELMIAHWPLIKSQKGFERRSTTCDAQQRVDSHISNLEDATRWRNSLFIANGRLTPSNLIHPP
jgi:hypothetical protein